MPRPELEVGVVIGNGISRRDYDLGSLRGDACLIGCNAIVRDLRVDYCVAQDLRILMEWDKNPQPWGDPHYIIPAGFRGLFLSYLHRIEVYRWPHEGRHFIMSGLLAFALASDFNFRVLYVVGFDDDHTNLYAGTANYQYGTFCERPGAMTEGIEKEWRRAESRGRTIPEVINLSRGEVPRGKRIPCYG
jgi:hypothetical protein